MRTKNLFLITFHSLHVYTSCNLDLIELNYVLLKYNKLDIILFFHIQ